MGFLTPLSGWTVGCIWITDRFSRVKNDGSGGDRGCRPLASLFCGQPIQHTLERAGQRGPEFMFRTVLRQAQAKSVGVEEMARQEQPLMAEAINAVADDWMLAPGKVDTNLVGPSRMQFGADQRKGGSRIAGAVRERIDRSTE
jgi:hypothetical protein